MTNRFLNTKRIAAFGAAAILTLGTALAQGPRGGGPGGGRHGGGFMGGGMMAHVLDLTDAQKQQMREIQQQSQQARQALQDQLKPIREQERAAVKAGKSDAELAALASQASPIMTQLHALELQTRAKQYKILTQAQKDKLEKFLKDMEERRSQRPQGPPANN